MASAELSLTASAADIRLLLFDVGGVLVEVEGATEALRELEPSLTAAQFWRRWLLSPTVRAFETGQIGPPQFAQQVIAEFGWDWQPQQFLRSFIGWPSGVFDGVPQLLARLPSRYQRALLSNSNVLHWSRIVEDMGLGAYFEHAFASHLTHTIKPDAAAFQHVLEALDCRAGQVLLFDDNPLNVEAARSFGLQAQLVRGPAAVEAHLQQLGIMS